MMSAKPIIPAWASVPIEECGEPLVDCAGYGFVLDPQYFTQGLSSEQRMYARKSVAEKLSNIQKRLAKYRFKIWDAFRPREVQMKLYARLLDSLKAAHPDWDDFALEGEATKYVNKGSDPAVLPPHATGGTLDLTLVDAEGNELNMGTAFDHFGLDAASLYFENGGNDKAKENQKMLRGSMIGEGFRAYEHEWWHYEYGTQRWAFEYKKSAALYGSAELL